MTPQSHMRLVEPSGAERREFKRHDLEGQALSVEKWDGARRSGTCFGTIVDLSAGGVRIRTDAKNIKTDNQIRVRLELPAFAGICPFIERAGQNLQPKNEWVGWMTVSRVRKAENGQTDVAGRLVDMDELDRGMLRLYLSTQPLAA